jgi:acetyltransferase-like isoleucine patch superfamily enzyme
MTFNHSPLSEKLLENLRQLYQTLRLSMRNRWKRDLPLEELLFDRWERARSLGFGENTSIYHNSYVYGEVSVGANVWIGPFTLLDGTGGLTIGDNCSISAGVQIYTHDSVRWALSGGKVKYEYAPVKIGNNCYIGPQTVIAKGVSIGDHCLIGACSFVNSDIPPFTLAFGVPCRPKGVVQVSEAGEISWYLFEAD